MSYEDFLTTTSSRPVSLLVRDFSSRIAPDCDVLDLGCGAGVETEFLARQGHHVVAVDKATESVEMTARRCQGLSVVVVRSAIEDYPVAQGRYGAIIALNSLPFVAREHVDKVLKMVEQGVQTRGFLIMKLFGPRDDWAKEGKVISIGQPIALFQRPGQLLLYQESEKDAKPIGSNKVKHWHTINVVYQVR